MFFIFLFIKMSTLNDLQKILQEINDITYKNIVDLEVGHKYAIRRLEPVRTSYGDRTCVHCRDFKILLPESISSRISPKHTTSINNSSLITYILYNGIKELPNGKRRYDIMFTTDSEVD